MQNGYSWVRRLSKDATYNEENPFLKPLIELCGDERLFIENHYGVIEYGAERIGVLVKYGIVHICGHDLRLCHMSNRQLLIRGKICSISLSREE